MDAEPPPSGLLRVRGLVLIVSLLVALAGVGIAASTIMLIIRVASPLPVDDQWDNLISGRDLTLSWLVSAHNEHRLLVPRLIFILDWWLAKETYAVDIMFNLAMQATTAGLLLLLARPKDGWTAPSFLLAVGLVLATTFSAVQYDNFTSGFQVQFFAVCLGAVATFTIGALVVSDAWALAGVAMCEAAATYSLANGLIVPYVALAAAVAGRRSRAFVAGQAVVALALTIAYLHGYQSLMAHSSPLESRERIGQLLAYAMAELGGPLAEAARRTSLRLAIGGGIVGCALLLIWVGGLVRATDGPDKRRHIALVALAAFALATTVVTGLGRMSLGTQQALQSRYATPVLLFWLAMPLSALSWAGTRRPRAAATIAAVGLTVLFTLGQHKQVRVAEHDLAEYDTAIAAVLAGVRDREMLERIYPDATRPLEKRATIRAAGTTVFAVPWTRIERIQSGGAVRPACGESSVESVEVGARGEPGWRVTGRLPVPAGQPIRLLMLDRDSKVVGYGTGPFRPGLLDRRDAGDDKTWWIAEVAAPSLASIRGVVLGLDDAPRCELAPFAAL